MNKIKIILGVFALSILVSAFSVNASSYLTFLDITIPRLSKTYTSEEKSKDIENLQYIETDAAIDDLSGDSRAILAKVTGTDWIEANGDSGYHTWGTSSQKKGTYNLYLKAKKSTLSTASYWGTWYIDGRLIG